MVYKLAAGLFGVYRRSWKMHCYLSLHSLCWRARRTRWATETLVTLQGERTLMLLTSGTSQVLPELSNMAKWRADNEVLIFNETSINLYTWHKCPTHKQETISPFHPSLPQSSVSQPAAGHKQHFSDNYHHMIEDCRSNVKMYEQG